MVKEMVKDTAKKSGGIRTVYVRARSRVSRAKIPIMGVVTLGALAGNVSTMSGYGAWKDGFVDSPVHYLKTGDFSKAGGKAAMNLSNAGTYTPLLIPIGIWIAGRMLLGKRNISKRFSLF